MLKINLIKSLPLLKNGSINNDNLYFSILFFLMLSKVRILTLQSPPVKITEIIFLLAEVFSNFNYHTCTKHFQLTLPEGRLEISIFPGKDQGFPTPAPRHLPIGTCLYFYLYSYWNNNNILIINIIRKDISFLNKPPILQPCTHVMAMRPVRELWMGAGGSYCWITVIVRYSVRL